MMGVFDFLNYNYSAVISIFAALVGMAYPLILQMIQRVDEMYDSTCLARYVQGAKPMQLFNIALIAAVFVSFITPFVLSYLSGNGIASVIVESIHSIVVLALVASTIYLYGFFRLTQRPPDFLEYIDKNPNGGDGNLMEICRIAVYASNKDDRDLYYSAMSKIIRQFQSYRKKNSIGVPTSYPNSMMKVLLQLKTQAAKKETSLFTTNNHIACIYYEMYDGQYPISDEELKYIWATVDAVVHNGNPDWVYNYWTFADQYYRFVLKCLNAVNYPLLNEAKKRFLEMHTMLGAMFSFNHEDKLLRRVLYFTNEIPPSYHLIPGSLSAILDFAYEFEKENSMPFVMRGYYNMIGMASDVNADSDVADAAYRYLGLLAIRLFTIHENFYFQNIKGIPSLEDDKAEDVRIRLAIGNRILAEVNYWYDSNRLNDCLTFVPKRDEVSELLGYYISDCEKAIGILENMDEVDEEKIDYIKTSLIDAAKSKPPFLPTRTDSDLVDEKAKKESFSAECNFEVQKDIIKKGTYTNASNLPELIIDHLNEQVWRRYNFFFLMNSAYKSYTVDFADLCTALDKLGVDDNYAILSLGVYLGTYNHLYGKNERVFEEFDDNTRSYNRAKVFNIPSNAMSVLVMFKDTLPYIELSELNGTPEVKLIDKDTMLYSNVELLDSSKDDITLSTYRGITMSFPEGIRYVRLRIVHYSGKVNDVNSIEKFV